MTTWKEVQGSQSQKPEEFDITSSNAVVYQRRNIRQVTTIDENTGKESTHWVYDERKITKSEYEQIKVEILQETVNQLKTAISDIENAILDLDPEA